MKYADALPQSYKPPRKAVRLAGEPRRPAKKVVVLPVPVPVWKRAMDLMISTICIALIMPVVLPVLAVFIKLVSPHGPVFFKQVRVGIGGKTFTCLKFRTMHPGKNELRHNAYMETIINGEYKPMTKIETNPNIIPFGRIIRKSCLDELPQLFNVLLGDMSIVGPRPCIPYEAKKFCRWHHQRFDVLPGMTGLWQVSGKNRLTFMEMVRLDVSYAQRVSLWLDLWIILKTPAAILEQAMDAVRKKNRAKSVAAWRNTGLRTAAVLAVDDEPRNI